MAKSKKEIEEQESLKLWLESTNHSSNDIPDTDGDTPKDWDKFNKKKLIKSKEDVDNIKEGDDIFVNM